MHTICYTIKINRNDGCVHMGKMIYLTREPIFNFYHMSKLSLVSNIRITSKIGLWLIESKDTVISNVGKKNKNISDNIFKTLSLTSFSTIVWNFSQILISLSSKLEERLLS